MWDYRVMRRKDTLGVFQVYYSTFGRICGWSSEPMSPQGATPEALERDMALYRAASDKPVLDEVEQLAALEAVRILKKDS